MMHHYSPWGGVSLSDELAMLGFGHAPAPGRVEGSGAHIITLGRKVVFRGTAKATAEWLAAIRKAGERSED